MIGSSIKTSIKNIGDFQLKSSPFLLIHKDRSISSWLGFLLTLIIYPLSVYLCWEEVSQMIWLQDPKIIVEDFTVGEYDSPLPPITYKDESFDLAVDVKGDENFNETLNDSYLSPELALVFEENLKCTVKIVNHMKKLNHIDLIMTIYIHFRKKKGKSH